MNIKRLLTLSVFIVTAASVYAQLPGDKRLQAGIQAGYRTLSLSDINNIYSFHGYNNKPYKGTPVVMASVNFRPSLKKRWSFVGSYQWMPSAERSNNFSIADTLHTGTGKVVYDSTVSHYHSAISITTVTFTACYNINIRKVLLQFGAGASYNTFEMKGEEGYAHYSGNNPFALSEKAAVNDSYVYNKEHGIGFTATAAVAYKVIGRLYANASLAVHFTGFALRNANGDKIWKEPVFVGIAGYGYFVNRNQVIALNGLQGCVGLSYSIF